MTNAPNRPKLRRNAGFTLIELLTVIAIIATMMSVLLPAVFKAQEAVAAQASKELVGRLTIACQSYKGDWDTPPAAVSNPGDPRDGSGAALSPARLSGCQNLRLALVGYERSGSTLTPRYQGSAEDVTKYDDISKTDRKAYMKKYAAEELVLHSKLRWIKNDGTAGDIELFADTRFEPARPVLYYRKRGGSFHFSDNDVYCTQSSETSGGFDSLASRALSLKQDFFLVWAGVDRKFFTDDDYDNVGR